MIEKIIEYSARNRVVVLMFFALVIAWGGWSVYNTPVDAIPDLSDNQVIVFTDYPGRSPQVVEDQVTYPLAVNLQGLPQVRAVRASSAFGFSMIYVIFEDKADIYWARTRVLERLNYAASLLPTGVVPTLGPDGTGVGHVFWYTIEGKGYDLEQLRTLQDWFVRYQLNTVQGVAEVASIGGFVREYQIDLDPHKLFAYNIKVGKVMDAVKASNKDVGGRLIEQADAEYLIRGSGYVKSKDDLENIVVGADMRGTPVYLKNLGTVQIGGAIRRGLLEMNGEGEKVGGIVVMRYGENAKEVIDRVKTKITELEKGLPPGVRIKVAYDRSDLISRAVDTLKENLLEESIIVSLVILVFLLHFPSALEIVLTLPNVSITEAKRIIQVQDTIIKSVPEVEHVLGKVGRAETSTDPAPVSMFESIIILKPKAEWRKGMTKADIVAELDSKLQQTGVRNGWTQPIINRINMLSTGVRTDLGVKIFGNDLNVLKDLAIQAETILKPINGAADVVAERVTGGNYLDIDIDRQAAARYGVSVGDIQDVIETALGGEMLSTTVEGRNRFPIRIRYLRDYRDNIDSIRRILVGGMEGSQIPLSLVTKLKISTGAPEINSEGGLLRSLVYLNVRGRDMGGFVTEAKQVLEQKLKLPAGYYVTWSGQWENQIRAKARLQILIPLGMVIIFILLFFTFHSAIEASMVMLSVPFALVGGVYLVSALGYNLSVAVWVGFIALYGIAVETGVVMVIYLHEALDKKLVNGPCTEQDIYDAAFEGAVLRLRPKLMTVAVALLGLIPIMWSAGTGADVMKPIAAPMIGGMISSAVHVLIMTPVIFVLMKTRDLKKGRLHHSGMKH